METVLVKPKNKAELELVTAMLKRMNISAAVQKKQATKKKKAKEDFLNSLSSRLNEVKLHTEGKIKLKSWDELYSEL
jgi:hypothetical protein